MRTNATKWRDPPRLHSDNKERERFLSSNAVLLLFPLTFMTFSDSSNCTREWVEEERRREIF